MPDRLTEDELADRAGTNREGIRKLIELGILRPEDGTFARGDVMRARVVSNLDSMGIEPEALAKALASGHLTLGYLEVDYFGRTVNIAARIAAQAPGGHVYVGGALAAIAVEESFRLVDAGEVELKSLAGPVSIFEAVRSNDGGGRG